MTSMVPSASISTPQTLVPRDFDETVTRQSWDVLALIHCLSAGRAQRLSPAWSETHWQGNSRGEAAWQVPYYAESVG